MAWPFRWTELLRRAPLVCVLLFAAAPVRALTLAEAGRARVHITLASGASPAESTAAHELARYLSLVSGARFVVYAEEEVGQIGPSIHVGPTETVRSLGPPVAELGPEEWIIRGDGPRLLLFGGRPRGALYAVFRFLEGELGVRWWTPYEEHVPIRSTLEVGALRQRGSPVFVYRDVHGVDGPRAFFARNRINGHFAKLSWSWGGTEGYGPPNPVHNFDNYVPAEEFALERPELFSEIDGARRTERSQLCLTNASLLDLVAGRMERYIEGARREAELAGVPPPRLFGFSPNDRGYACECTACSRVTAEQGSQAGPLVEFVNALAERIGRRHPDVMIDTLAYYQTFEPPREATLRDNVVVRLSALQYRDFAKPVDHRANERYRRVLDAWAARTGHLRIWDYTVTFGRGRDLPLPNSSWLGRDLRYYRDHGVEGVFVQHDHPIASDLRDLKLWVLAKLLEDPGRDERALVEEFTEGYYGPAGVFVRRYLRQLEHALRRRPSRVGYPARVEDHAYLDLDFLVRAHDLFDRAEAVVAGDASRLRRVRHARLSVDRATLLRLRLLREEWRSRARHGGEPPLDVSGALARYRQTWHEQIESRTPESRREERRTEVDREIAGWLSELGLGRGEREEQR